jgi:quinol monooxygenase YgiN
MGNALSEEAGESSKAYPPTKEMIMPLTIVAHITAAEGKEDFVFTELKNLVAPTLAEAGCIQYDLHRDNDNPAHFMFYEHWETRELWQDHINSAHIAAYVQATEGAVTDKAIYEMTQVD